MSLRTRLLGLFAAVLVLLAGTGVVVVRSLDEVERTRTEISGRLQPASVQSRSLLVALVDQETGERGYLITGDESFLDPYRQGLAEFDANLADLRAEFAGDAALVAALGRVDAAATAWRRLAAEPEIAAVQRGDREEAARLVGTRAGKLAFDNLRGRVADVQTLIDGKVDRAQAAAVSDARRLRVVEGAALMVLLGLLVLGGLVLRKWALQPVLALRGDMRAVAAGDLDRPVQVQGPSEVAALAQDAEAMRRRIVEELDQSRAAREALAQHSPVVAGLRRDLTSPPSRSTPGVLVAGRLLSAEGVLAGDWWEAVPRSDGSTAVVVADVSGHGAEAGLVAARFKHRLSALLETDLDPAALVEVAARDHERDAERFIACLLVLVHPSEHRVRWVNAGHPAGLLLTAAGSVRELGPTGPLVSAVSAGWAVAEAPFEPGDLLVLCTDGILEARDAAGEELGDAGVLRVLRSLRPATPATAVEEVCEAARRFAVDVRRDDVTCVAVALDGH